MAPGPCGGKAQRLGAQCQRGGHPVAGGKRLKWFGLGVGGYEYMVF